MSEYDLHGYGTMIMDATRDMYAEALRKRINEQSRVLDLGSGTGYFALLALSLGAKKVYAVEPDIQALRWIELCGIENGIKPEQLKVIGKRIEQTTFEDFDKEPVDLIVSDVRGVLPGNESIQMVIFARQFLKSGGEIVSKKDYLFLSPIESPYFWLKLSSPWSSDEIRGVKLTSCFNACLDSPHKTSFQDLNILASPSLLSIIDYEVIREKEASDFTGYLSFEPKRFGVVHGFALWFDSNVDESNYFSNAPGRNDSVLYRQLFFPLRQPCAVAPGHRIFCNFSMRERVSGDYVLTQFVRSGSIVDSDLRTLMTFEQEC